MDHLVHTKEQLSKETLTEERSVLKLFTSIIVFHIIAKSQSIPKSQMVPDTIGKNRTLMTSKLCAEDWHAPTLQTKALIHPMAWLA